jgi:hypothetical protein
MARQRSPKAGSRFQSFFPSGNPSRVREERFCWGDGGAFLILVNKSSPLCGSMPGFMVQPISKYHERGMEHAERCGAAQSKRSRSQSSIVARNLSVIPRDATLAGRNVRYRLYFHAENEERVSLFICKNSLIADHGSWGGLAPRSRLTVRVSRVL